ncbi:protein FAM151B isoform X3 [Equus asinus]|uniref:protein FAM151B isoform X3 n=1 Tax=Equus asinus TaxID=9793 RepID=UPI0038F62D6F
MTATAGGPGSWSENILEYFLRSNQITAEDGAQITWYHAANHKAQVNEALKSTAHMIEADVLLPSDGSEHGQPIMAHPPETNSDNTLQEWLAEVLKSNKGIKLDFKSLAAVEPSLMLLENVKRHLKRPVWINADILPGPNGHSRVVDAKPFIDTVTSFFPDVTLSLGWTTGWHPEKVNEGYSWTMVKEMEYICNELNQPVTFPVRAALVRQSCSQLLWLLKKSHSWPYSLNAQLCASYWIVDWLPGNSWLTGLSRKIAKALLSCSLVDSSYEYAALLSLSLICHLEFRHLFSFILQLLP